MVLGVAMLKDAWESLKEMAYVYLVWPFRFLVSPFRAMSRGSGIIAATIENWGPAQFIRAIEPVAILIAIFAFTIEMADRREERIARAWQLVTTKAPGNSGKINALEYLNSQDPEWLQGWWPYAKKKITLQGIDLTPPALAELFKGNEAAEHLVNWWDCPETTYLHRLQASKGNFSFAKLFCADLVDADLSQTDLSSTKLNGANLVGSNLNRADLLSADLRGADLGGADLGGADLSLANIAQYQIDAACMKNGDVPPILNPGLKPPIRICP
jgi:hypothetical protein